MGKTIHESPFNLNYPWDNKSFKAQVVDAGYTQNALAKTIALKSPHDKQDLAVVARRVKDDTPYNVLVRLFWLGRKVTTDTITRILPDLDIDALAGVGILTRLNQSVQSTIKLSPFYDMLMISDFSADTLEDIPAHHVLGVGAASITLANVTVRRQVDSVLDIGTGAGIQAFLARRHGKKVIGTDTNERALNFARLNAFLNDIDEIQWRSGSLYEPVANEKFDLIVSNPPFVISPETRFTYRDTALPGDQISQNVIAGASQKLNEGGFACILFNWYHYNQDDWSARPLEWVKGNGCDSWLLRFHSEEPLTYAAEWLHHNMRRDSREYQQKLDEWMNYYENLGIKQISAGSIVMRRRTTPNNWNRSDAIEKSGCTGSSSNQILRIFAAEDFLESLDDDQKLLDLCFIFDKDHNLEHHLTVEQGRWAVRSEHLHATVGIPFGGTIDMYIAQVLAGCDGHRTLRALITDTAARAETDQNKMIPTFLKVIKKIMRSGFLYLPQPEPDQILTNAP